MARAVAPTIHGPVTEVAEKAPGCLATRSTTALAWLAPASSAVEVFESSLTAAAPGCVIVGTDCACNVIDVRVDALATSAVCVPASLAVRSASGRAPVSF